MHFLSRFLATVFTGSLLVGGADAEEDAPFHLTQTIALPGVEGRLDHFAIDLPNERLFICALGNDSLEVIDLRKGVRVHSITGLGSPQGVGYLAETARLIVANDKGGACNIYDAQNFAAIGRVDLKG